MPNICTHIHTYTQTDGRTCNYRDTVCTYKQIYLTYLHAYIHTYIRTYSVHQLIGPVQSAQLHSTQPVVTGEYLSGNELITTVYYLKQYTPSCVVPRNEGPTSIGQLINTRVSENNDAYSREITKKLLLPLENAFSYHQALIQSSRLAVGPASRAINILPLLPVVGTRSSSHTIASYRAFTLLQKVSTVQRCTVCHNHRLTASYQTPTNSRVGTVQPSLPRVLCVRTYPVQRFSAAWPSVPSLAFSSPFQTCAYFPPGSGSKTTADYQVQGWPGRAVLQQYDIHSLFIDTPALQTKWRT